MSRLVVKEDQATECTEDEVVDQYDPVEELKADMNCLKDQMNFMEEIQSTTFMNLDSSIKSIMKQGFKKLKKEMDTNKDGVVTFAEGMHWLKRIANSGAFKLIFVTILSFVTMQLISAVVNFVESGFFNVGVFNTIGDALMGIMFSYVTNSIKQRDDIAYAKLLEDYIKIKEKIHLDKVDNMNELHNKDIVIAARDTEISYLNRELNKKKTEG